MPKMLILSFHISKGTNQTILLRINQNFYKQTLTYDQSKYTMYMKLKCRVVCEKIQLITLFGNTKLLSEQPNIYNHLINITFPAL